MTHRAERRGSLQAAALNVAMLLTLLLAAACSRAPEPFNATDITGANFPTRLELPDVDGRLRTMADFQGKVTVVFFAFTNCPDVCPTTLAELAEAKRSLGKDGDRLQVVLVTVDPERDTPDILKAYVSSFDPSFVALRGTPEQTQAVAKDFKVFYAKVPNKEGTGYSVDHTAGSYIFDTKGRARLFMRYGAGAKALAADIKRLLAEG